MLSHPIRSDLEAQVLTGAHRCTQVHCSWLPLPVAPSWDHWSGRQRKRDREKERKTGRANRLQLSQSFAPNYTAIIKMLIHMAKRPITGVIKKALFHRTAQDKYMDTTIPLWAWGLHSTVQIVCGVACLDLSSLSLQYTLTHTHRHRITLKLWKTRDRKSIKMAAIHLVFIQIHQNESIVDLLYLRHTCRIAVVTLPALATPVSDDSRNIWTRSADAKSNPISIEVN